MEKTIYLEPNNIETQASPVWRPYMQALGSKEPILIDHAEGALLYTKDDRVIVDAISSWWVTLHGHAHPWIQKKLQKQLFQLEHVMAADCTHQSALVLAEKLLSILPKSLTRVHYSDNGSTAVECALKIAFQYYYNQSRHTSRTKVMAFKNGYHGETFGAMSVSDRNLFAKPFLHALFEVDYIDPPTCGKEEDSIKQAQAILSKNETACFIFEPLVQGASGMKKHEVKGLDALIKLCHTHDVLTIADEVMTGFGRLGSNFAIDKLTTKPDMICLAKGLTGGFLPLAATLCTEKIYEQFLSSDYSKTFLHGHSYSANPLGCASAIASIELLDQVNCQIQRRDIEKQHRAFLNKWDSHPKIKNAFVEGTLLQIEYKSEKASSYFNPLRKQISEYFLSQNILIRPLGNSIHVLPPYSIKKEELALIYQAIENTLEKILW